MKTSKFARINTLILMIALLAAGCILPAEADETGSISFPDLTQTDCVWDGNGCLVSEIAHDLDGNPAVNSRGFYRAEYTWDEHGNKLSEAYYGVNEEPVNNTDVGYARALFTYLPDEDDGFQILTEDRYDVTNNRASIPGTYSYRRDTWQDGKNLVSSEFFDAAGHLTRPTGGYARILYHHDVKEGTDTVTKRYLDADGTPLIGSEGGEVVVSVSTTKEYLINGIHIEKNALDMMVPEAEQQEETERGTLLLSEEILDAAGNKTLGSDRWHKQVNIYDNHANLLRSDYYGIAGESILSMSGYASVAHAYDEQDRVIETAYYGTDGNLVKVLTGYAKVTFEYYPNMNRVHYERYFGTDDQRTVTTYGYSMAEYEYGGPDFDYRITYYDPVDEYTMCMAGYARLEVKFDNFLPAHINRLISGISSQQESVSKYVMCADRLRGII